MEIILLLLSATHILKLWARPLSEGLTFTDVYCGANRTIHYMNEVFKCGTDVKWLCEDQLALLLDDNLTCYKCCSLKSGLATPLPTVLSTDLSTKHSTLSTATVPQQSAILIQLLIWLFAGSLIIIIIAAGFHLYKRQPRWFVQCMTGQRYHLDRLCRGQQGNIEEQEMELRQGAGQEPDQGPFGFPQQETATGEGDNEENRPVPSKVTELRETDL